MTGSRNLRYENDDFIKKSQPLLMAVKICCGFGVAGSADNGTTKAAGGGRAVCGLPQAGTRDIIYRENLKCRIQPYHERCAKCHTPIIGGGGGSP